MKKALLLFLFFISCVLLSPAQVIIFHEDFELPSQSDSLTSQSTPTAGYQWNINTRLHSGAGSLQSDSCQVVASTTIYLVSNTFNTTGNTYVILNFSQICKIDFLDIATIEVSADNGTTWSQLTSAHYLGTGQYGLNGNRFAANSYGNLWQPSAPTALPMNTWWKQETFDIGVLIGNKAQAKIRFKLADGGTQGPNNNKGWYLDNVKVTMAPSELVPPVITLATSNPVTSIWGTGPFTIKARIQDQSGISSAHVAYTLNGGAPDTVAMTPLTNDTMMGIIPAVNDSDVVCYYVFAYDNSLALNYARNPVASCVQFIALAPFTFPYFDNMDGPTSLWIPSYGGTVTTSTWERGTPNFGATNSTHSPPNAWDVNLNTAYQNDGYCLLTSPYFDFSGAVNARLQFWVNYMTESGTDGVRLEYSINNGNWQILGTVNDPLGENWYGNILGATNQPGWSGNSNGWKKCKFKLSALNNTPGNVRFRFMFNSNWWTTSDGFSVDDWSITLPAPQEITCEKITSPQTDCGLSATENVTVKIFNAGLTAINGGFTASYQKNPAAPVITETINNTIAAADTLTYTFATPVDVSAVGADVTYNFKAWVTLPADPNHGDDTTYRVVVSKFLADPPAVANATIPYGTFTTLNALSLYPITWYDAPGGNALGTGSTYTTPILYGTTIYYPTAQGPNGCPGVPAHDTVFVGQAPDFDASAQVILSPNTGFNLTGNEIVRTRIRNYGTQAIANFPISYSINNGPPVTETYVPTLNPGDTVTYTFTAPANLLLHGNYDFKSWVTIPGDLNQVNDTAFKAVENKMYVYCESRATSTADDDIGNVTLSNLNNGNPLPSTGNNTSVNMYTDYTNLPAAILNVGQTYPVSVTQINSGGHYTCMSKIFIDWDYSGTFEPLTETAFTGGPTSSSNFVMSGNLTVPLNAHIGYTRMRVVLVETTTASSIVPCGTYTWGETEDYTVLVLPQIPNDAGLTVFTSPPPIYAENSSLPVTVTLKNFGTDTIFSVDISYVLDLDPPVTQTFTGTLLPAATTSVSFPAITWPTGNHTLCAYTTLAGDSNVFNDNICMALTGVPVDTLPYYNNFDGTTDDFIPSTGIGTTWIHGAPVAPNFPSPAFSSPNVWATNLNQNQYLENANCYLSTQIFDFSNAINAKISFWHKRNIYAFGGDGAWMEYSLDGGTTWQRLGSTNDPLGINWYNYSDWSLGATWNGASGPNWIKSTYLLSNFNLVPTMRFRFVFMSDSWTNAQGFGIDNFELTIPYPQDAGTDSILLPQGQAVAGNLLFPQVRLTNFGSDTLYSVPVQYSVNGGPVTTETWTGTIDPGDYTLYTFTTGYPAPEGNYLLKTFTNLANDGNHVNDSSQIVLFGIPTFPIPFTDGFDSTLTYWYTTGTQWEHGSPTSPVITYALSPPFCWKTNLDGKYSWTGLEQHLYSPMFDFTLTGVDSVVFDHWVDIYSDEGGSLHYLSTSGWKKLGWMGDPNGLNWYTNNDFGWSGNGGVPGWHTSGYDLSVINDFAFPTQFRFTFTVIYPNTVYDGWAIDNFRLVSPKIPFDAGVIDILQPVGQTTYGTDMTVTARIRNFGLDTLTTIPVKYQIDGQTVNAGTWTGTLLPDSTTTYTFSPYPSPLQTFRLCVYTDVAQDDHFGNDTTCAVLLVIPPDYDLLVTQIITPVSQTIHGDSALVKVTVKNVGLFPVSDIPVGYAVDGNAIVVQENFTTTQPLLPGDSVDYTFQKKYSHEYLGYYYLCSFTALAGDGYLLNDTTCKKLEEFWTLIPENESAPFYLSQNIPNPAGEMTQVVIRLPKPAEVVFEVVNMLGQRVFGRNGKMSEGEHLIDIETVALPDGLYYYYLTADDKRLVRKMIIAH